MKKIYLLIYLSVALFVVSCSKTGPEGPAGTAGAQGPKGDKGDNGTAGSDGATGSAGVAGTANVIYSKWFSNDEFSLPWADSTIDATHTVSGTAEIIGRAVKFAPDVTSSILDSGLVLSYVRSQILISPQLLPWFFSFLDENSATIYCQLNIVPQMGSILYNVTNQTTHDASALSPSSGFEYRYIIIPGGTLAGGRKLDPETMSYAEVCKAYHITP